MKALWFNRQNIGFRKVKFYGIELHKVTDRHAHIYAQILHILSLSLTIYTHTHTHTQTCIYSVNVILYIKGFKHKQTCIGHGARDILRKQDHTK